MRAVSHDCCAGSAIESSGCAPRSSTAVADPPGLWLDGVKYLLITAIEGCIDVAHHIVSSERYAAPDTNAAAIRLLGDHGVISPELAGSIARAVGFRNVLVHRYVDVDDDIVIDALHRLDELDDFVSQVSRWLLDQP